jgi:hypothetical protein
MPSREYDSNTYALDVNYVCTMKTTSNEGQTLPVLKFTANAKFFIKAFADKTKLNFQIVFA